MILDTCVLLWMAGNPAKLSAHAKAALVPNGDFYVSAISAFEIAIKHKKKKLALPMPPLQWFQEATRLLIHVTELSSPPPSKTTCLSSLPIISSETATKSIPSGRLNLPLPSLSLGQLLTPPRGESAPFGTYLKRKLQDPAMIFSKKMS
jgi:hypothetical protein